MSGVSTIPLPERRAPKVDNWRTPVEMQCLHSDMLTKIQFLLIQNKSHNGFKKQCLLGSEDIFNDTIFSARDLHPSGVKSEAAD